MAYCTANLCICVIGMNSKRIKLATPGICRQLRSANGTISTVD